MELSHTELEMLEAKQVCLNFDFSITKEIAEKIGTSTIIFAGMGSSLIFPGKQAKNRALKLGISNRVEAYFASDLFQYEDFSNTYIFLCSNSGKTKEVILLLDYAQKHGAKCIAVTAVSDSVLAQRADEKIILTCGFEQGVAATKSVIEQGLVYDSLIFNLAKLQGQTVDFNNLKDELSKAADVIENNANLKLEDNVLSTLINSNQFFMVGLENGVAEEIALKAFEITRKFAVFYPDTHIAHGVVEAIHEGSVVIFDTSAFSDYMGDFEKFASQTGTKIVGVGELFSQSDIKIAVNKTFENYCYLAGGWGLLRNIANKLSLDVDHPEKVSKVGNPFEE